MKKFLWFFVWLLAGLQAPSHAGQFSVNPVRVELDRGNAIAALKVSNQGDQPVTLQIKPFSWTQELGQDGLTPSRDLLASPPLFTLAPGAEQLVRVGLRVSPVADRELTYRLLFEEVLAPAATDFRGLRIALNISIPVFVKDSAALKASPAWRLVRTAAGIEIQASNAGQAHFRASRIHLISPAGKPLASLEGNFYVLPGKSRAWSVRLPLSPASGMYRLEIETDAGKESLEKTLE